MLIFCCAVFFDVAWLGCYRGSLCYVVVLPYSNVLWSSVVGLHSCIFCHLARIRRIFVLCFVVLLMWVGVDLIALFCCCAVLLCLVVALCTGVAL